MGTRSVTHVYESGECKLAMYTQFDSHFRSLGVDLLGFVSNPKNLKLLREALPRCDPVTSETMRAWFNAHPSDRAYDDYIDAHPDFLYGSSVQVLNGILSAEGRYSVRFETGDKRIEDRAYVIDLDRQTFEAYMGINGIPLREDERFYDGLEPDDSGTYPFRECGVFSLNDLHSVNDFVEICESNAYREG